VKSVISFVANLLLYLSLTTVIFAFFAYVAFKLRQGRRPSAQRAAAKPSAEKVLQAYSPKDNDR
jgi:hypothetical protein